VGAFVGEECRAVTPLIIHEGESFVSMVINGTEEENVDFSLWEDGIVYKSTTNITLKPGGSTNSVIPIRFNAVVTNTELSDQAKHTQLSTSPNPFNRDLKINVRLAEPDDFEVKIYSADSRLIRVYQKENAQAGTHQFIWDAKDFAGNSCAPGMYFIHLNSNRGNSVQKVIFAQ